MKVLMLQGYYEPERVSGMYLITNLVEDLNLQDHEVDIVTPRPVRGISKEIQLKYKNIKKEVKSNGMLRIHRYKLPEENKNTVVRAIRYFSGGILHIIKSLNIQSDVIVVNSTPPTNGLIAIILKKIKKIPVVYILQDVFPDSMVTAKMTKEGSLIWKIGRMLENFTYKNVDKIIVISEDFKSNLLKKGVTKEKISVVSNWVEESKIIPIQRDENVLIKELNLDKDKFYVVYAGNLGNAQNIEVILLAAKQTEEYNDIQYIIFGDGVHKDKYKQMAIDLNLKNVNFQPLQPYDKVSHVYSLGDLSIVSCKEGFGTSAMPSKTWSIMSTETAVVASFDEGTELEEIIENNNIGIFTNANDTDGLKNAIVKLYSNRNLCNEMGKNGREYIIKNLSRKSQTKKYIEIISNLGGKKNYV